MTFLHIGAQQVAVLSISLQKEDSTAIQYPRYDLNGDLTGVIKIYYTGDKDIGFRGNIVGNVVIQSDCRMFYLIGGTRRLHIYMEGSTPMEVDFTKYPDLERGIIGGNTYYMQLKEYPDNNKIYDKGSNILIFKSDIPIKRLSVNGYDWPINGLTAKRLMPFGEYEYRAYSISDKLLTGKVEVVESIGNIIVKLKFEK